MLLQNRVALITGGESGIGAACATALMTAGASVAVTYFKDETAASKIVEAAKTLGRKAVAVQADVGDEAAVERAFQTATEALGPPDILVNSAGLNQSGVKVVDMELAQWNRLLSSDLTGAFLTCREFLRGFKGERGVGRIINISSIHAEAPRAGAADYDSAKGGMNNLTTTLALECAPLGITVNAIEPGMILTPMNEKAVADLAYRKSLEANIPMGRAGAPSEVADLAVFLASPAAGYITGARITIDGALSLLLGQGA